MFLREGIYNNLNVVYKNNYKKWCADIFNLKKYIYVQAILRPNLRFANVGSSPFLCAYSTSTTLGNSGVSIIIFDFNVIFIALEI